MIAHALTFSVTDLEGATGGFNHRYDCTVLITSIDYTMIEWCIHSVVFGRRFYMSFYRFQGRRNALRTEKCIQLQRQEELAYNMDRMVGHPTGTQIKDSGIHRWSLHSYIANMNLACRPYELTTNLLDIHEHGLINDFARV